MLLENLLNNFIFAIMEAPASHKEAEAAGFPQLDFSTYPSQIFWLVVFFALLYVVMTFNFLPKISSMVEKRRERIADDLEKASELEEEIENIKNKKQEILKKANEDAFTIITNANLEIDKLKEKKLNEQREKLLEIKKKSDAEFAEFNNSVQKTIDSEAKKLSDMVKNRLLNS